MLSTTSLSLFQAQPTVAQKDDTAWQIALAVLAFGLMGSGWVLSVDALGIQMMLGAHQSPVMPDAFWASLTLLGSGWAVIIVVAALDRHSGVYTWVALLSVMIGGAAVQFIKKNWPSLRPGLIFDEAQLTVIGETVLHAGSMPSGHAAAAAALVTLVFLLLRRSHRLTPRILALLIVLGSGAVWSRVAVGAHWPGDVLVGAALGILTAQVCFSGVTQVARSLGASFAISYRTRMIAIGAVELMAALACLSAKTGQPSAWLLQGLLGCIALISCLSRFRKLAKRSRDGYVGSGA